MIEKLKKFAYLRHCDSDRMVDYTLQAALPTIISELQPWKLAIVRNTISVHFNPATKLVYVQFLAAPVTRKVKSIEIRGLTPEVYECMK